MGREFALRKHDDALTFGFQLAYYFGIPNKGTVYQLQTNLASIAYEQLLHKIVTFKLVPGTTLQERQLAEQLQMSRTPVREALNRLTHEGWVQSSLKRNMMEVKPVTREDVNELFGMRELFEMHGTERIFEEKANTPIGAKLQGLADDVRNFPLVAADEMALMTADIRFHTQLMYFKDASRLSRFWEQISLEFIRLGITALRSRNGGRSKVGDEHDAIVESILRRRKKQTRETIRYHNEQTKLHIFKSLDGLL